jgi:hypothetical protein
MCLVCESNNKNHVRMRVRIIVHGNNDSLLVADHISKIMILTYLVFIETYLLDMVIM